MIAYQKVAFLLAIEQGFAGQVLAAIQRLAYEPDAGGVGVLTYARQDGEEIKALVFKHPETVSYSGKDWDVFCITPIAGRDQWQHGTKAFRKFKRAAAATTKIQGPFSVQRVAELFPAWAAAHLTSNGKLHLPHKVWGDDEFSCIDYRPGDADCTNDVEADPATIFPDEEPTWP